MMTAALALGAGGGARADDEALRALGLGLSIFNNMQQQQLQQQQRQPQATRQRQQQGTAVRQAPQPQVDTAAARREREAVEQVQALLNRLGYDAGPVDGAPGPRTRDAIAAFRADYGLAPGAAIDAELTGALRGAARNAPAVAAGGGRAPGAPAAVNPPLGSEPEPGAVAEVRGGTLMVDGRVATTTGFGDTTVAGIEIAKNLPRLVSAYGLALAPDPFSNDEQTFEALKTMPPELALEIIEEALRRPLNRSESSHMDLEHGGGTSVANSTLVRNLDPFQRRRLLEGIRARADRIVRRDLPEPPLPIRVYCGLSFGDYDFATEAFPVTQPGCDESVAGADRAETANWGAAPDRLAMPPDQAEQFAAAQGSLYNRLVSFDAMLDIDVRTTEAGSELVLTLSDRTNFRMYVPGSYTEVLVSLDQAAAPVAAAVDAGGRAWDLADKEELEELAALADVPVPFPFDGRALMAMPPQPVGTVTDLRRPFEEGVYAAFSPANDALADRVAAALAVPRERLVQLALVSYDRGAVSAALALLPAPAEAYAGHPPADRYGRSQLVYSVTSAIDGVHLFEAGSELFGGMRTGPVLVARLRPVEARFVADAYGRNAGEVMETFDLTGIPASGWEGEAIVVPPRYVQLVKAIDALGDDPVPWLLDEGVGSSLNEFERRDAAAALVARARADTTPIEEFWVAGEIRFGDYGFDLGAFPAQQWSLGTIDVLRPGDLAETPFRTSLDKAAFDMPMPQDAARAWVEAHPGGKHPYRARVRVMKPESTTYGLSLDLEVLEVEILDKEATLTLRDPRRVLYRYGPRPAEPAAAPGPAAPAAPEVAAAPAAAAPESAPTPASVVVSRDILGVGFGSPLAEAVAKISAELAPTAEFTTTRELRQAHPRGSQEVKLWDTYVTARLFYAEPSRTSVALYSEPPEGAETVTAVLRAQSFAAGARPHPEAVRTLLVERYGPPALTTSREAMIWFGAQNPEGNLLETAAARGCRLNKKILADNAAQRLNSAQKRFDAAGKAEGAVPWVDADGQPWVAPDAVLLDIREVFAHSGADPATTPAKCAMLGEMMLAVMPTDEDGLVRSLQVVLSDPAEVARIGAANEQRMIEAPESAGAPLEIKL